MGEDPRAIREEIEDTRERMGETVQALSAKADVPGRIKGYASEKKDALTSTFSGAADGVVSAGSTSSMVMRETLSGLPLTELPYAPVP